MGLKFYKTLFPPKELQLLKFLKERIALSDEFIRAYDNDKKGYLGERKLYQILKQRLTSHCVILFDLLLKANGTTFQIDCLIIFPKSIYIIEVKNFSGDFYLKDDKWFSATSKSEIRNPLLQLQRTEYLFGSLLRDLRVNFPIQSYLVFVNDEFWLYEAPMKLPIIYQPQLQRFVQSMNHSNNGVYLNDRHTKFAEILLDQHLDETPYVRLPTYEFKSLQKGLICLRCDGIMNLTGYKHVVCPHCCHVEGVESVVMRHVVEYSLLFPNEKITVGRIYEWCGQKLSRRNLTRILAKYMKVEGKSKQTHYVFNFIKDRL